MEEDHSADDIYAGSNNRFVQPIASQYYLKTTVTAIERSKKDPIIRFDAHTNLPGFRTTQFRDIRRTHHEFEKLADHLIIQNAECMVPALYPGATSYGAGTEEDDKKLKTNMQHWLDLICRNTVLVRDNEIVHFVESDFGWSPVISKGKPATGIKRRAIKQLQPPPDDNNELVDARPIVKQFHLLTADSSTKLSKVIKTRASMSLAEREFGRRLTNLAEGETHLGMANAFNKLGRTIQAVSDARSAQATLEAATLGDALDYHSSDAFIAKETLTTRQFLIRELNQAQNASRTKELNASRLKSSTNLHSGKVDEALASFSDAKASEQQLASKLNRVTTNLVSDSRAWRARTSSELQTAVTEFARKQVESERRVLAILESVRPDVRSIDGSGGLSRLGRTNLQRSGSNIGPSQTPEGDAWSGSKRLPHSSGVLQATGIAGERKQTFGNLAGTNLQGEATESDDKVNARNAASILAGGF